MTETQTAWMAIRLAIHNTIIKAESRMREENPRVSLELLLTLDRIEVYALKMMWTA